MVLKNRKITGYHVLLTVQISHKPALTGPEAGSDAGGIPDVGTVCMGMHEGKETLGIKLNWNKRYITLAIQSQEEKTVAAFKLQRFQKSYCDKEDIGITCAYSSRSWRCCDCGRFRDPLGLAFMNGPTRGHEPIPMEWLIGGADYAGKGWRMLVECLSAGRGICRRR